MVNLLRYLKNGSDSRWRRCTPLQSAHDLSRLLRFFIGVRLALGCDLLFLRWLLIRWHTAKESFQGTEDKIQAIA